MQTVEQIDAEIEKILNANTSSSWLQSALRSGLSRDPIGVANDAELVLMLFTQRLQAILHESGTPPPVISPT